MQNCVLPTFGILSEAQEDRLNSGSHIIRYRKGQAICHQGHPISHVLFVKSGLIKVYSEYQEDRNAILQILGPGSFICIMSVFDSRLYQTSSSALEDSEVVHARLDDFIEVISQNGGYAVNIMKAMSRLGFVTIDKVIRYSYKQIPGRLAELILLFSRDIYGKESFEIPMSRQEIADYIFATKETVSRTLSEFKNDRIIDIEGKVITLKSVDLLDRLSIMG